MASKFHAAIVAATLALTPLAGVANTLTSQTLWGGSTVTILYPDKVTFNTPFDVSFKVDATTMTAPESLAFDSAMLFSNTVNLSAATWSYDYFSTFVPNLSQSLTGSFNDASGMASLTSTGAGHSIIFSDPHSAFDGGTYSWIWRQYNESVQWTVHNAIIAADTTVTVFLTDVVGDPGISPTVLVLDPPALAVTPVPEPAAAVLLLAGLLVVGWRVRRERPAAFGAPLAAA